ncbi:hypothetical protein [uncultured Pseudokineococcus sp.]|uniref:hypothetical protein n=1 Tax=uncultured Pseudokineococcus sp. TaxID=1642928 RepID=UPI0026301834|nr:hypothetical protein [uncultured Pseudokineococcus sp.]
MTADLQGVTAPATTSLAGLLPAPRQEARTTAPAGPSDLPTAPPAAETPLEAAQTEPVLGDDEVSPADLRRAVVLVAVVPALVVSVVVGDAGGALDASSSPLGLLPGALLLLPGGSALVHLLALALLGAVTAGGVTVLRHRSWPSSTESALPAAAVVLALVAPLLGLAVTDPALACAVGAVLLAGGCCARAVRRRDRAAATGTAAAAVALVVLVLPLGASASAVVGTLSSPSALLWLVVGSALLVPVVHGRARLLLAATSAGAAVLAGVAAL